MKKIYLTEREKKLQSRYKVTEGIKTHYTEDNFWEIEDTKTGEVLSTKFLSFEAADHYRKLLEKRDQESK